MKKARKAYRKSANGRRTKKTVNPNRETAALRKRKAATRKARIVKRHAKRVTVPTMDFGPVRNHVALLCREWRREERELDHAFEADNANAMRVHERNMERLESEMRRIVKSVGIDRFPVWVDY